MFFERDFDLFILLAIPLNVTNELLDALNITGAEWIDPLDALSWNDQEWTWFQAELLEAAGYNISNLNIIDNDLHRGAIKGELNGGKARWPGTVGEPLVVPYRFEGNMFNGVSGARQFITDTLNFVTTQYMEGCIQFLDDTNAQATNFFIEIQDGGGCSSAVGYLGAFGGNSQSLTLNSGGGVKNGGCLYESVITHEFLHALGFNHEQTRPDRDDHVIIHTENIQSDKLHNFQIMTVDSWYDMESPYDGQSVMHYGASSFLTNEAHQNGLFAITSKESGLPVQSPRVGRMSSEDCFQLQKMYKDHCPALQTRQCDNGEKYLKNRGW